MVQPTKLAQALRMGNYDIIQYSKTADAVRIVTKIEVDILTLLVGSLEPVDIRYN